MSRSITRVKSLRGVGDLRDERGRAVVRTKRLSRVPLRRKKKTPKGRWTCKGDSEEPREKREGEDAAPSGRMNGATSDVEREMLWRSRIARHCSEIDYRVSGEDSRNKILNNDYKIMNAYVEIVHIKENFSIYW